MKENSIINYTGVYGVFSNTRNNISFNRTHITRAGLINFPKKAPSLVQPIL